MASARAVFTIICAATVMLAACEERPAVEPGSQIATDVEDGVPGGEPLAHLAPGLYRTSSRLLAFDGGAMPAIERQVAIEHYQDRVASSAEICVDETASAGGLVALVPLFLPNSCEAVEGESAATNEVSATCVTDLGETRVDMALYRRDNELIVRVRSREPAGAGRTAHVTTEAILNQLGTCEE